ncbi:MAG: hypothetical protein OXD54_12575 [Candidatus Poribacteria bacterium]|nr:hypothetical protein [Candidatus Poribacteria bacterium]
MDTDETIEIASIVVAQIITPLTFTSKREEDNPENSSSDKT